MKDSHKDCIREIQELMLAINETVKKYELEDEVLIAMAVGFYLLGIFIGVRI